MIKLTFLLLIFISCHSSQKFAREHTPPLLISATRASWTAGHMSGGRGVDFTFQLLHTPDSGFQWKYFLSADRKLELTVAEQSGDTLWLNAYWLSNTDKDFKTERIPDFSTGILHYNYLNINRHLPVTHIEKIQAPFRP